MTFSQNYELNLKVSLLGYHVNLIGLLKAYKNYVYLKPDLYLCIEGINNLGKSTQSIPLIIKTSIGKTISMVLSVLISLGLKQSS